MTMQNVPTEQIDPERLYASDLGVTPVARDWSEGYDPDGFDGWTYFEAVDLDEDGARITDGRGYIEDASDDDEQTASERRSGPLMSYAYPLPGYSGDPCEDARELVDLPVCLVHDIDADAHYLALTGGGMDLSWEISEAYMRLGYLPPVHFDLPGMAGRGESPRDRAIVAARRRALEITRDRAADELERLNDRYGSEVAR